MTFLNLSIVKNKKTLYILVPLVVIVWGLIIYRICNNLKKPHDSDMTYRSVQTAMAEDELVLDTFTIIANYRDPFLGKTRTYRTISSNTKSKKAESKRPQRIRTRRIRWPVIVYNGVISDESKGKNIALVSINNNSYLMKTGEINEEVTLLIIFPDSIRVEYQEEVKTFVKTKN